MPLILVIGDLHVPHRAPELPEKFKTLLQNKIDQILCTGNLNNKHVRDFFRTLTNNTVIVVGSADIMPGLPETEVVTSCDWKIGLFHGHSITPVGDRLILSTMAYNLGVDILITGHTHEYHAYVREDKLFLNPGTATGAYSGLSSTHIPSMILLDVQKERVRIYRYQLVKGEVDVQFTDFQRPVKQ